MGISGILYESVLKIVQPMCGEMGLECVELKVNKFNESVQIVLFVDLPTGGIGIEECSRLNRRLDKALYEDLKLGDDYTLEVSSPGLDRPLMVSADFRRSKGNEIRVFLRERVEGRMEVNGILKDVQGEDIVLGTRTGDVFIPINKIEKAKNVIS